MALKGRNRSWRTKCCIYRSYGRTVGQFSPIYHFHTIPTPSLLLSPRPQLNPRIRPKSQVVVAVLCDLCIPIEVSLKNSRLVDQFDVFECAYNTTISSLKGASSHGTTPSAQQPCSSAKRVICVLADLQVRHHFCRFACWVVPSILKSFLHPGCGRRLSFDGLQER